MPDAGYYQFGERRVDLEGEPDAAAECIELRDEILPRITRLLEADHVSLLLGSGFTIAAASILSAPVIDMSQRSIVGTFDDKITARAQKIAASTGRGSANVEDQFRAVLELIGGLRIQGDGSLAAVEEAYRTTLGSFARSVLQSENEIVSGLEKRDAAASQAMNALSGFMLAFGRKSTRERLHIFTTNYDRLIEYACDLVGLWTLDRFIGGLNPRFRASRLDVDLHYNPPGIRGEPRFLEGVVRLTKLHGSIDWFFRNESLYRAPMPFGCSEAFFDLVGDPADALIVYPNPAKDVETGEFPYAELFRDFSSAVVRPHSVLITYGYGFGDDHINRVIHDMVELHATHLLLISHSGVDDRIEKFLAGVPRVSQVSLLVGRHFGDLSKLTKWYLPRDLRDFAGEAKASGEPEARTRPEEPIEVGQSEQES